MTPAQIVVVGSYNHDVSFSVARLPAPGETCLSLARLDSPGGKGSNQAIQAARCGAATAMIAAIGTDAAGDEALALWAVDGIATQHVGRLASHPTGMATILVDAMAENVIVVDSGANAHLAPAHIEAASALIGAARLVLAQFETPVVATVRAFEIARAGGVATLLNAAPAPEAIEPALLALTDVLVVNEGEGRVLSGHDHAMQIGEALLGRVGRAVVVTLGAQGAVLFEHHRPPLKVAPPKVEVVDTTGAGDAFTGAFAARWAMSGDMGSALAWGVAAGALACTRKGAAASCAGAARIAALLTASA
jgi:ribokinase